MNPADWPAESPSSPISILKRVSFIAVGLAGLFLLIELFSFAGVWLAQGERFSWSGSQQERRDILADYGAGKEARAAGRSEVPHPYLGYVRNPDSRQRISQFGYPENTPLFTERSEERVIVAVVGGSVAFHFAKAGMPAVFEQLKADPEFAGREFVLVNLAVGGYKQPQQLMTLNYLLALGFEFDVVVNLDGFNEVALHPAENAKKDVFPIYPRNWYARVDEVSDETLRGLMGELGRIESGIAATAASHSRAPWRFSITSNLVWQLRHERWMVALADTTHEFRTHQPEQSPYAVTGPRDVVRQDDDVIEHLVAVWKRSSIQLDHLCRANGIRYYHFLQPNQYVAGSKTLCEEERSLAFRDDHPYRPGAVQGYPLLIRDGAELTERGVSFVDLTEAFADESGVIYSDDCCHYNDRGYRMLATRVAETILEDHGSAARNESAEPVGPS